MTEENIAVKIERGSVPLPQFRTRHAQIKVNTGGPNFNKGSDEKFYHWKNQ